MTQQHAAVKSGSLLVLASADVRRLVPTAEAIDSAREAFLAMSGGQIVQPPRISVPDGSTLLMFAQGSASDGVVKVVSVRPGNSELGLPSLHSIVIALDEMTGQAKAIIEGSSLTAMRTGAASGLATQLLAAREAGVLAVIGAGAQAADQVRAVCSVRPIAQLRVASRRRSSAERLVTSLAALADAVEFRILDSPREAVEGADVVCTATTSSQPLFEASDLKDVVHVNAIGAHSAGMREIPPELLRRASVLAVDQVDACLREAGDVIQAIDSGFIERNQLVEIGTLLNQVPPPAPGTGISIFKSVGVAAQDWALVKRLLERAETTTGLRSLDLE